MYDIFVIVCVFIYLGYEVCATCVHTRQGPIQPDNVRVRCTIL